MRHQPDHPPQAETRAQSIDQMRELGVLIQRRKAGLRWVETLGHQGREPQHVETEPGIAGIAQHGETVGKQTAHALGIAHRRTGAEFDAMHGAVGAEQRDLKKPRPLPAPLEQPIEIARKLLDGAEHVGFKRDRIGKTALHQRGRDRQTRLDRLILAAERLVDPADELNPETGGERGARTLQHIADVLEPDLRQRIDDLGRKSQRGERQRRERCAHLGRRHQAYFSFAEMRHREGTAERIGDRDPGRKTLRREPRDQIATERLLATEQMRTTGDIERKTIGRREPDQRGEAVAPVGDCVQQTLVRVRIGVFDGKRGIHGARVGECHAGLEPQARRGVVERRDAQRRLDRSNNNERLISRRGRGTRDPIGREPPQPHRQIAPGGRRVHGDPRQQATGRKRRAGSW